MRHLTALTATVALMTGPLALTATPAEAATPTLRVNTWATGGVAAGEAGTTYRFTPASSGYYLVTLGDLSADYDLTILNPSGAVKASSSRTGAGVYEERAVNLVAGQTYRIIVGTSKVAGSYALRALKLKAGVRVVDVSRVRAYNATEGGSELGIRVFNNTDKFRGLWYAPSLEYRDAKGHLLIQSTMKSTPVPVLAPHSMGYIHVTNTPAGWKSVKVTEEGMDHSTSSRPLKSSAVDVAVTSVQNDDWDMVVTNKTDRYVSGQVNYLYFDKRGRLVNVADDDGAGTGGAFTVDGKNDTDEVSVQTGQDTTAAVSLVQRFVYAE